MITTVWEGKEKMKKELKDKEEVTQFIRNLLDIQLLNYTRRRYPEQLPQVAEAMLRGDRILARLDEIVLLLRDLSEEIRRQKR
ncbi:MAG: hypothetical protein ABSG92_00135 [Conexivisphaerales archaeon]